MKKAKGYVVMAHGTLLSLCVPADKQKLPDGVEKVLFISSRPTLFSKREYAKQAIQKSKEFDKLNGRDERFPSATVRTLYES